MKTKIVILAAGRGTRMGSELPKVLVLLKGKSMISCLMKAVYDSGVDDCPIVVVSPENKNLIEQELSGYKVVYAIQEKQLGTGHAVGCARSLVDASYDNVLVLYGDHPFLTSESIKSFALSKPEALTIMPTLLPDFKNWHHNFFHLGRIARDDSGRVSGIIEFKDASDKDKEILEINMGFMCFNRSWLFDNIDNLNSENKANEFYLTDLVKMAATQNRIIDSIMVGPRESMGINSKEELAIAEELMLK
ncbi:MAG: NTP transferase domain-containing protein [Patescibacteria group bacterium]|nr:NTP transferase domain-containing protein [Patescibacteria group bacterium]